MSTLASLAGMLGGDQIRPWDIAQRSVNAAGTGLIELQEMKEKQAAQALLFERIKNDPAIAQQLFGGSTLGALGAAPGGPPAAPGGPPGAGPLMQQQVMPGQPAGVPQVVPGGQDLSRFATGGPPPPTQGMPTLATLGQPQGQASPLLEMARRDPRAAMMLQQQLEQRQDVALKRQEQQLKMGTTIMESLGRRAQVATDQASWDLFRQDAASIDPRMAAQLPQVYSKDARDRVVAQALDVKDALTLQVDEMKARADQIRAGLAGRTDAVNTELEIMGLTPSTASPTQLKEAADRAEARQVRIHKAGVTPQIVEGEGGVKYAIDPHTLERRPIPGGAPGTATGGAAGTTTGEPMRGPMTEGQAKTAGYTSRMQSGQEQLNALEKSGDYATWKLPLAQLPGGRLLLSGKQKEYETAKGVFLAGLLRYDSAGQITETEWKSYGDLYFPQYGDEPSQVEQKRQNREQAIKTHQEMLGRPLPGQKTGTQAQPTTQPQPTSQAPAATGPRLVSQADLQSLAQQRSKALGRPVTVEEVKKDLDPKKFRTQ